MDKIDRQIINKLQGGFPVIDEPFKPLATELNIKVSELIKRIQMLLDKGILSRFGPLYNAQKMGGALSLCALQVPSTKLEHITEVVNEFPEVAHNYLRNHELNMWFVLATKTHKDIAKTIRAIEKATNLIVYNFPKEREYFLEFKLVL